MAERGSRWQSSVRTYGPVGRMLATGLLVFVLLWFLRLGPWGLAAAVIWFTTLMPWALRDIWRPAALPDTDLTRLRERTERELRQQHEPTTHIALDPDAEPPTRW